MLIHRALIALLCAQLFACMPSAGSVNAEEMLEAHNKVRATHGLQPLVWDEELAVSATDWSEHLAGSGCDLTHSQDGYGENLYMTSGWASEGEVVNSWADEAEDYDTRTHTCAQGKVCGHFTQIIWAKTERVGCGMARCGVGGEVWTCKYDPLGNYAGRAPF